MCSVRQRYSKVENYFVHRRCRPVDVVEPIKSKPVEVGILVVRHGAQFASCCAQRIASFGRRCCPSLIRQKPARILQRIDGYVNPRPYAGVLDVRSTSTGSSNRTFDSDIYGHSTDQQLRDFQNRLCNTCLARLPACQLERIQSILNYAVRIIYGRRN